MAMLSVVTAQCTLDWLDASGSTTETRLHTLANRSVGQIENALQSYGIVARGISDCAITGQEIAYYENQSSHTTPISSATNARSLVLVFNTANDERYFSIVIPSPKEILFTADTIPTINILNDNIVALSQYVSGRYTSPDGYPAVEMVAAVYSEEF